MATTRTYQYGGALDPKEHYYIRRKADDQLLDLCVRSEFAHIFNARQTGKSSLLARTYGELKERGFQPVLIDLEGFGSVSDADRWYYNVAYMIAAKLGLNADLQAWWAAHTPLTPTYRWVTFFKQVVLAETTKQIVVFIDEIDRTRSLPFRDDIFSALRQMYNDRATMPELRRLSFTLAGLATPQELIGDLGQTSYNIGEAVELGDLTEKEGNVKELAEGLGLRTPRKGQRVLGWVLNWTGGHPYLTQKLCALIAKQERANFSARDIDRLVADEFMSGEKEDSNLTEVATQLTREREGEVSKSAVLEEFERVLDGDAPDRNSPVQAELKLTGVVKVEGGQLRIRNRIYRKVFDRKWLQRNTRPSLRERWRTLQRRTGLFITRVFILTMLFAAMIAVVLFVPDFREAGKKILDALFQLLP